MAPKALPCGAPSWFGRLKESPLKADLAIYIHVLGVPGQYESVALMLRHKMDFYCCANRDGFHKSSHKYDQFKIQYTANRISCANYQIID